MEENKELSYFEQRCQAIGLTPERNKLCVKEHKALPDSKVLEYPLLTEDKKTGDILIPVYDLDGHPTKYLKDNPGRLNNQKEKFFEIRRYKPGNERKNSDGEPIKYDTPKGAKTLPWISPNIIQAVADRSHIDTIVITEGYIKGICGWLNGLHIFALSGIQNFKDKDIATLHPDILRTIDECKVNNIVLLYDGDCTAISLKAINEDKDLYQRPVGFYHSARNIVELLKDHKRDRHFDIYFAHVNTENLEPQKPKGLDDLYQAYPTEFTQITTELTSFSKQKSHFFHRINITAGLHRVLSHLHINNAETFYTYHQTHIGNKPFIFHGTKYQWDEDKKNIRIIVPGAAKNYFRVGDNYYEKIKVPNKYGTLEYRYDKRQKGTIIEDHGKDLMKHIPKYKAFCTKPDHVNYQEVIDNCFNRYRIFEHTIGISNECPETLSFLKHIFGNRDIEYTKPDGTKATVNELDLGLDYIQLLYQKPTQMLPILCLVSRENNTGKSTFAKLLKAIFTGNMAIIGNADLENDFNAGWADKLLICCEESFIDKKKTVEKIKSLSTGDKIQMNQKGIDQTEIDFFGKFLFMSNNEENFVIANEHDERFWVRRVPKAQTERTNLLELMIEEVPNFLYYLNNRNMAVSKMSRMWFAPELLRTDALKKLIEGNRPGPQRELTNVLRHLFMDTGFWKLRFNLTYICETLLRKRYERNYIERLLKDRFTFEATKATTNYKYPAISQKSDGTNITDYIQIYTGHGKPYVFTAGDYLSEDEMKEFVLGEEAINVGQEDDAPADVITRTKLFRQNSNKPKEKSATQLTAAIPDITNYTAASDEDDDLPF
jgi:hypothetical protein